MFFAQRSQAEIGSGVTLGYAFYARWPVAHTDPSFSVLGSAHHAKQWNQIKESHGSPPGSEDTYTLFTKLKGGF